MSLGHENAFVVKYIFGVVGVAVYHEKYGISNIMC